MAVINVTAGSQAILTIASASASDAQPGAANGLAVPLLQDLTVSTTPGTVRYSTLDSTASSAFTTVVENEVSFNMLLDETTFFGDGTDASNTVKNKGLWETSNDKTEVFFSVAFEGADSTDYYFHGKGFIGGIAPTASIDQAVWISPGTIIVNGNLSKANV